MTTTSSKTVSDDDMLQLEQLFNEAKMSGRFTLSLTTANEVGDLQTHHLRSEGFNRDWEMRAWEEIGRLIVGGAVDRVMHPACVLTPEPLQLRLTPEQRENLIQAIRDSWKNHPSEVRTIEGIVSGDMELRVGPMPSSPQDQPAGEESSAFPVEQKPWGTSQPLYRDDQLEIALIRVKKGGYSSLHHHETKANEFVLLSGEMFVESRPHDWSVLRMPSRREIAISSGRYHRFFAARDSIALEVYRQSGNAPMRHGDSDIVRHTKNGRVEIGASMLSPPGLDALLPQPSDD